MSVHHFLNNKLAVIDGNLQLLLELYSDELPSEVKEIVNDASSASAECCRFVASLEAINTDDVTSREYLEKCDRLVQEFEAVEHS